MKYNNVIFLGLCLGLTTYSALSADSVIKISGRVLDYGCTVSSDSLNFTVDLQKNSARQFPTTGSTSPAVPFQATKASGVGVSLMRNGKTLATGENVSLGTVNKSKVPLGLSATYGQTGNKVAAGAVQSVIGVTFIYE